ncbi:zinc finger protein [Pseudosulfitobacter pseudonitzschiae]|uniref:zinc finger protein n=1 Tax=Pseudosulfitobacter pseudonitzschiae TaxID=1402135 RepID=UPI003B80F6C5
MSEIREGRWDCSACGNANLGRFERCRSCGMGRGSDVAFYLPEGQQVISDAELLEDALSGPDWHCDHCDSSNKAMETSCVSCGNGRDGQDAVHDRNIDRVSGSTALERRSSVSDYKPSRSAKRRRSALQNKGGWQGAKDGWTEESHKWSKAGQQFRSSGLKARTIAPALAIIAGLLALVLVVLSFTMDFEKKGYIEDLTWQRSIGAERIVTLDETGWSRPGDAYEVESRRKIRSYKTVTIGYRTETRTSTERYQSGTESYSCGQESLGNGYFRTKTCTRATYSTRPVTTSHQVPITEEQPVWDTWYSYKVDRWREIRRVPAMGGDTEPEWPEITFEQGERAGSQKGTYTYAVVIDGDRKSGEMSLDEWIRLDEGDTVTVTTNFWGRVKRIVYGS